MDWTQYALRRTLLRAEHGRRPLGEAVACRLPSFFTPFSRFGFLFFDFLHFGHIHVFCEEGVKMCFFLFWLFSAVFLCGRFQYGVRNRWNSAVFVFSTVFVWTIPVCVIITKAISVLLRVRYHNKCSQPERATAPAGDTENRLVSYHGDS